jgi:protein involved in polysaccharide export with SLBB domain
VLSAFIAWLALFTAGCSSPTGRTKAPSPRPETRAGANPGGQYKIQPGDLLVVTFAGEPDYNQQIRVDWDGRISLAFLGQGERSELNASGLSAAELARRITNYAKEKQILVNPRSQVLVAEFAGQAFVLLGQVTQPGRYAFPRGLPPRLDLEEAIALGGGYTRLARQSRVLVKRGTNVYPVDLRKLSTESGQPRFVVLPGDVITVTERLF